MTAIRRIGILGFGEAGSIFGAELARSGREVAGYDILLDARSTREAMRARIERAAHEWVSRRARRSAERNS